MQQIIKVTLTLVLGFLLTFVCSWFMEKGQTTYHVHKNERMQVLFADTTRYDILYIGSSRTHTTIDPVIVDSITGLNSYNAGVEGGTLSEFRITLDGYLETHPAPSMLLLTLDAHSFYPRRTMFYPPQYFRVLDNPVIKNAIEENPEYRYWVVRHLPFLRTIYYDDYTKGLAIRGLMGQNELTHVGVSDRKGFLTNGHACADTTIVLKKEVLKINDEGIENLRSIISTCRQKNIKLIFTHAPEYRQMLQGAKLNFEEFIQFVTRIANDNGIPFYRDDLLPMCQERCLFANYGHVNTEGAIEYSKILGHRIRSL